jgi:hypothetical protein
MMRLVPALRTVTRNREVMPRKSCGQLDVEVVERVKGLTFRIGGECL